MSEHYKEIDFYALAGQGTNVLLGQSEYDKRYGDFTRGVIAKLPLEELNKLKHQLCPEAKRVGELLDIQKNLQEVYFDYRKNTDHKLEKANQAIDKLLELLNYASSQEEQDYGMEESDAKNFRMRKVFSVIDEALESEEIESWRNSDPLIKYKEKYEGEDDS